jgi:putative endonuclease
VRSAEPEERGKRRRAYRRGAAAEWLAATFLLLKGYRLLARRYTAPGGEIDLIVRRGPLIAFVEVKTRSDIAAAETSLHGEKRRRINRAIRHWLRDRRLPGISWRADAVYLAPWRWPRHVPGAFEIDLD